MFKINKILKDTISELSKHSSYQTVCHKTSAHYPMPSITDLEEIVNLIRQIIFPGFFGSSLIRKESVSYYTGVNVEKLYELLTKEVFAGLCFELTEEEIQKYGRGDKLRHKADGIAAEFISKLPEIRNILVTDVEAAYLGDPAAQNRGEVIFCYPAVRTISSYRVAHALYNLKVPLIPRIITEMAHSETGIDIHPRATIGEYFTIDHGTGVVIGATTIIGNNVQLYQGVTLGAKSFPLDENGNPIKGIDRHPIIEDNVIIYAQATILGRVTVGANSVIGGNVWITEDVPPNSKIVQSVRSTGKVV